MNDRSWVWAFLLVLVIPATSAAQLLPAPVGQEAVCDQLYKDRRWPIHFHGKFQGVTMPFAWYDNGSSGQGTLTYQDANHVTASWRDTGKRPGESGSWYLSR